MDELSRHLHAAPSAIPAIGGGRKVVVVIGVDEYQEWANLRNAVKDAEGVLRLFTERLGFTGQQYALRNEEATQKEILKLVKDSLRSELKKEDCLVIFFAGHGHTVELEAGGKYMKTGYLVPVDAQKKVLSDLIEIDEFLKFVSMLPPRHILVILDACHSGFAVGGHRGATRYEIDLSSRVSRKVIASTRPNQQATDGSSDAGNSLFTKILINGFESGEVDEDKGGFVTSSAIGLYLEKRVGKSIGSGQTPVFGSFVNDDLGEMVIQLPGALSRVKESAPEETDDVNDHLKIQELWLNVFNPNYTPSDKMGYLQEISKLAKQGFQKTGFSFYESHLVQARSMFLETLKEATSGQTPNYFSSRL